MLENEGYVCLGLDQSGTVLTLLFCDQEARFVLAAVSHSYEPL